MTRTEDRGREMLQVLLFFGLMCALIIWLMSMTGMIDISDKPIIRCDPTKLERGQSREEVRALCGQPSYAKVDDPDPWYPLHGDTGPRSEGKSSLHYGNFNERRSVNIFFEAGKLRSVQIYGDWR